MENCFSTKIKIYLKIQIILNYNINLFKKYL